MTISDRDLADLAFSGLLEFHKEKLEGQEFLDVSQVLQKALANESRGKESRNSQKASEKSNRPVFAFDCNSDDEEKDVYSADFVWSSKDKPSTCSSLRPTNKYQQDDMKFTFDVTKCDRIFDDLLKIGKIKLSHTIPPLEELKKRAYCKFHNSYSHAINDCNVFRRQIQSAINEERLVFHNMQTDYNPFPVHALELKNPKVLIRPDQAEKAKGKNVIIGEERTKKKVSFKETPQVAAEASTLGGQGKNKKTSNTTAGLTACQAGLTACSSEAENSRKFRKKARPSFEELLAKYKRKGAAQKRRNQAFYL